MNAPALVACLLGCLWSLAWAQPSSREIVEQLQPRGISARGISVQGGREKPAAPPSINLEVNFEYGSAVLSADAKIVLDNLGHALSDPSLLTARIEIAGHTDAAGGEAYNRDLSRRRAQAVADYLVREHRIAPGRLAIEGYGKSRLLDKANPLSSVNRRVQVVNLGN
jgi:outer membrane protein OmpA-like peptidoglycan-associated protein